MNKITMVTFVVVDGEVLQCLGNVSQPEWDMNTSPETRMDLLDVRLKQMARIMSRRLKHAKLFERGSLSLEEDGING